MDDGTELVYELLEEIVNNASSIVLNNYVKNEIYPYAVEDAKNKILEVIAVGRNNSPLLSKVFIHIYLKIVGCICSTGRGRKRYRC